MSVPRRMAALRRLFLAKLEDMPSDMPEEARAEAARNELDNVLGPEWRKEVEDAGFGMDPTGDEGDSMANRLQQASVNEGFDGGNIPEAPKVEKLDKASLIERLSKFIHG